MSGTPSNHRIAEEMRGAIEALRPNLRKHMRFALPGKVVAVHDDNRFTVDVEIADTPAEGEEPGDPLFLPDVPVSSLVAGDGWGFYAMPEEGSEVSVAFRDGDVTQPRIEGSEYLSNRTPIGGRVGSFTFADSVGQRFSLRPDTGEMIIRAYNLDSVVSGTRNENTTGDRRAEIKGDDEKTVGGNASKTVKGNLRVTVEDGEYHLLHQDHEEHTDYEEEMGAVVRQFQHGSVTHGSARRKIEGREEKQVGGDRNILVLGDHLMTSAKGFKVLTGGPIRMFAAGLAPDGSTPGVDQFVSVELGGPGMNVFGGKFVPGVSQPMVNGTTLGAAMTIFIQALKTAFIAYNVAVAGLPNPVTQASLASATVALNAALGVAIDGLTTAFGLGINPSLPSAPILSLRNWNGGPF